MQFSILFRGALLITLVFNAVDARADLSSKQARKLISRMAGFELPTGDVRVKRISSITDSSSEATAEIQTVFRLARNEQGQWRIAEVRTGPDHWEQVVAQTNASETQGSTCDSTALAGRGAAAADLTVKRARCLIASLLSVELPSDAVRVKEVTPLAVPLASAPSALVVTVIQIDVRFAMNQNGWHVSDVRTGSRPWFNLDAIVAAVHQEKGNRARAELAVMATALEGFRKEHGVYVVSEMQPVLIDYLSPRYLARVIRIDPWHRPYKYSGERDHFSLRSLGADGTENTRDDIVVTRPVQTTR
ncbi:MAG: type II secretion system protein GspG [Pyrinomonadaceae bacterium]